MPFCPKCNKYLADSTDTYCPDCGTRLIPQATTMTSPPVNFRPVPPKPSGFSPRGKLVVGVVVLVIAIIVIGGVASALSGGHNPQPSPPQPGGGGNTGGNTGGSSATYYVKYIQSGSPACMQAGGYSAVMTIGIGPTNAVTQTQHSEYPCASTTYTLPGLSSYCVWAYATVEDFSARTTLTITDQNGQVLVSQGPDTSFATLSVASPTGCSG